MTTPEILAKIHLCCSDVLAYGAPIPTFTPASSFEDMGADSLDHVEIIMAIEAEFGVNITDRDAEAIKTVQQAVDYLQTHA